jgi:acyl-CoA reductase-like NAD-dependent aldehyde dehydrogenase
VKIELDSLLEGLEAKLWLLIIAEMEVLLAEEILAALDELTTLAESSRLSAGATATHRAKRLEATVARIDAELEAIERLLTVNAGRSLRPTKATSESSRNGQFTATPARRNRGRPRKPETDATTNVADPKTDNSNAKEAIS